MERVNCLSILFSKLHSRTAFKVQKDGTGDIVNYTKIPCVWVMFRPRSASGNAREARAVDGVTQQLRSGSLLDGVQSLRVPWSVLVTRISRGMIGAKAIGGTNPRLANVVALFSHANIVLAR